MSRHRHVRNMRYDDYDDDDYYTEDSAEEDYPNDDMAQYMWNPTPAPAENDNELLSDLAAQFRQALNDNTLQEAEIDAAIIATDYDVDAALALLREQREQAAAAATADSARLESRTPSAIAQMLESSEEDQVEPVLPDASPTRHEIAVDSGTALPVSETNLPVQRFRFDRPSPDDVVRAKQAGAGTRAKTALRMPKASALRNSKAKVANREDGTNDVKGEKASDRSSSLAGRAEQRESASQKTVQAVAPTPAKAVKQRVKKLDVAGRAKKGSNSVSIVVAGHVDAGKSTLLGHFLRLLEERSNANSGKRRRKPQDLAWGTDEDSVERERGVTIDIATRVFKTGANGGRTYAMIDAPGHRDFVPAMILGASQASAALLVVDASPGEFEAGFSEGGQTREHALVLKSLGVTRLIVVVNKMDVAGYSQERYEEVTKSMTDFLRNNGWKQSAKNVTFVATSGRDGLNLIEGPDKDHPMSSWYTGKALLTAIEETPSTATKIVLELSAQPARLVVSDFFKSASLGGAGAVTGRLLCGSVAPKDKLVICPGGAVATVKNIEVGHGVRKDLAIAGVDSLPVSVGLMDLTDGLLISTGNVLCDPETPVPVVTRFRAQLVTVTTSTPIIPGSKGVLHVGGGAEAASVTRLLEYVGNKKGSGRGGQKKRKPRRLVKGETAIVEITCDRAVAMEKAADVKALGRFVFRQNGKTVGVGIVNDILETAKSNTETEEPNGDASL